MAITPFRPVGIGMTNSVQVFRITFSNSLSDIPRLTAYDTYTADSTTNTIFSGTAYVAYPMIAAVGDTAPGVSDWFPATPVVGDTTVGVPNMLKGSTNRIRLSSSAPGAGGSVVFNIGYKIPYDVTTLATMSHILACEYQYTGPAPTLTFQGNQSPGTEGSPNWTTIDSLAAGTAPTPANVTQIRPCDTGKGNDGDATYRMSIPNSGQAYPQEIWLKNY